MRALIVVTFAALSLAACRNNDQADNTTNVDENLSAENIVSNDVTAIDAVTGADANMAADVNFVEPPAVNETGNATKPSSGPSRDSAATKSPPKSGTSTTQNSSEPAAATNGATE